MRLCLSLSLCIVLTFGCSATAKTRPSTVAGTASTGLTHRNPGATAKDRDAGTPTTRVAGERASACPSVERAENAGPIGPKSLNEASGLVASRVYPRVLWLHNDSGDTPRLFVTRDDGVPLGIVDIQGAEAVDWEDIALGPGPVVDVSYLFLGDIGDNNAKRKSVQIYRVPEPALDANGKPTGAPAVADRIEVTYEDGAHDAETLLADPISGDLYIVQKALTHGGVYRVPAPAAGASRVTAKRVAQLSLLLSTGGDVLPHGDGLVVRTYTGISYWPRDPAEPLEAAFARTPCALKLAAEQQGEAVGFFANGEGYYTLSEGEGAILHSYKFLLSSKSP